MSDIEFIIRDYGDQLSEEEIERLYIDYAEEKEISVMEWETYVYHRDSMLRLETFAKKDDEKANREWAMHRRMAEEIEGDYPDSDLQFRYKESLALWEEQEPDNPLFKV